jgi:DNA helicase-2/ATP-dependent DNA helicase PcrA
MGPGPYLDTVVDTLARRGQAPMVWCPPPEASATNPVLEDSTVHPWPVEADGEEVGRRREAAALVSIARAALPDHPTVEAGADAGFADMGAVALSAEDTALVAQWDEELDRLVQEARESRAGTVEVPLPSSLSATSMARLRTDAAQFAEELARPMPRQPSPAARFGTRFHAWVESRFGQQGLVDLDEVSGRGDAEVDDDTDLQDLIDRFTTGPFGERTPFAVEPPFALVLGGQVVRGRIDAVYETDVGFLVVDWKTSRQQTADPLQLAVYRVAWAELQGVPVDRVEAAFYYVRTGDLVTFGDGDLAGREELTRLLDGLAPAEPQLRR